MPDVTNHTHRANKRVTFIEWCRRLAQVPDPDLQSHCANLIFWDYLGGQMGAPRAGPGFREIMNRPIDYTRLTQETVAATLRALGYCQRMASERSVSQYFPEHPKHHRLEGAVRADGHRDGPRKGFHRARFGPAYRRRLRKKSASVEKDQREMISAHLRAASAAGIHPARLILGT